MKLKVNTRLLDLHELGLYNLLEVTGVKAALLPQPVGVTLVEEEGPYPELIIVLITKWKQWNCKVHLPLFTGETALNLGYLYTYLEKHLSYITSCLKEPTATEVEETWETYKSLQEKLNQTQHQVKTLVNTLNAIKLKGRDRWYIHPLMVKDAIQEAEVEAEREVVRESEEETDEKNEAVQKTSEEEVSLEEIEAVKDL